MSPTPARPLSARARRLGRSTLPTALTLSLFAGALAAIAVSSGPANADGATTGTFTIGDNAIALNQPSDPEMGALTPSADAATNGMFGSAAAWPIIPLHAAVARNGHVITYGTPLATVAQSGIEFDDWDTTQGYATAAHTDVAAMNNYNSFCNAAVSLADGRLLMVSGQTIDGMSAGMMTMLYDPITGAQTMGAGLAQDRWYPTALRLTDNRILLLGGGVAGNTGAYLTPDDNTKVDFTPEIGDGTSAWTELTGAASTALFGATDNHWWYPRAYNGPNGTVVGTSGDAIWTLDPNGNGSVQQTGTLPFNPKVSGSQVMFAPGQILYAGGGQVNNGDEVEGTRQAALLNVNGATPTAVLANSMQHGRNWLNLTVLPNGEVLANGGTIMGTDGGDANSVKQAEIWSPVTGDWRTAATAQMTRTYHSVSMVLPSGAVFTGGGGNPGPVDNFNAELYYPAYLFNKAADGTVQWASRPAISTISGSATYGGTVALGIGDGRKIASASLISLPVVTHSQNTDQRRIPLDITQTGGTVSATLPGSVNTMPPGDYELTVVDADGVPSAAQIITIRTGDAGQVTVATAPTQPAAAAAATVPAGTIAGTLPAGGGTAAGTGGNAGTGSSAGTPEGAGSSAGAGKGSTKVATVTLAKGSSIGIAPSAHSTSRIAHTKTKLSVKRAGSSSSKTLKKSTSWVVHTGIGSKKGYSFESLDKPGYYLAAPLHGSGTLTLVKKSSSKAFAKRATFSAMTGVTGRNVSFRVTGSPTLYIQTDGSRMVVRRLGESSKSLTATTFVVKKGLATKR